LLRNCLILSVFQSSSTSYSFRIRSCPDPDLFFRIRIRILLEVSDPDPQHCQEEDLRSKFFLVLSKIFRDGPLNFGSPRNRATGELDKRLLLYSLDMCNFFLRVFLIRLLLSAYSETLSCEANGQRVLDDL
jgi:hypothetical protein